MDAATDKPAGRQVLFMATCLCDAFFAETAKAAVEVLEHAGCEVLFPGDQTCCGQPAFNAGDFASSRKVARHTWRVFSGDLPVIVPSGSCTAMCGHGNALQFEGEADLSEARSFGRRTWELCDYLVNGLGIETWPGRYEARVALHHSCHTRGSGTGTAMKQLLSGIAGLELSEFGQPEQCCGFGGTFSVTFPHISGEMGRVKLDQVLAASPDLIVSADGSCLMHLGGLAARGGRPVRVANVAEILRDALLSSPAPAR